MYTMDSFLAAQKAAFASSFALSQTAFAAGEKLVALNVATLKATMQDAAEHAQALMSVKDAQELFALQTAAAQPTAQKAAAYSRHVTDIATSTGSEFTKAAEAQTAELQTSASRWFEGVTANAPAGSDAAMAFMKNAMAAAQSASDTMQKAVKQASAMAEANMGQFATQAAEMTATAANAAAPKRAKR